MPVSNKQQAKVQKKHLQTFRYGINNFGQAIDLFLNRFVCLQGKELLLDLK